MNEHKNVEEVDAMEIEPLSDEDLEMAAGGTSSVGCTQSYTCQCGTGSCCSGCKPEV